MTTTAIAAPRSRTSSPRPRPSSARPRRTTDGAAPQRSADPAAQRNLAAQRTARAAVQRYTAAQRAASPQPAHVYGRRRLAAVAALVLLVSCMLLLALRVGEADAELDGPAPAAPVYVVQPGDTLWSIAQQLNPGADPRELVGQLSESAGGTDLVPGQRLELPRRLG